MSSPVKTSTSTSGILVALLAAVVTHGAKLQPASPVLSQAPEVQQKAGEPNRVKLTLFYETLCPFCQHIFSVAIKPLWEDPELRKRVELELLPYGNARTVTKENITEGYRFFHREVDAQDLGYVFTCQHGPSECFGNLVQACAMDIMQDPGLYVPFAICMAEKTKAFSAEAASYNCANEHKLPANSLRKCVETQRGNHLMFRIGEKTKTQRKPGSSNRTYVPWVLLDGSHNTVAELDDTEGNSGHLISEVCALLQAPMPSTCSKTKKIKGEQGSAAGLRATTAALLLPLIALGRRM